jgi:hypothetical protein
MLSPGTNTTLVGRLRIRSKSSDPQTEKQRVERMLRSTTLHPSGLPESSILIVRRLADPLPSRLRAGPRDLLPEASWQRAVTAALEALAASAARPAFGAVPVDSNAVLFCDRAEVLASLARDWMNGALPLNWWWRELLRGRDSAATVFREWIASPQYVPGAIELLSRSAHAVPFVQRLTQPLAAELVESVLSVFSVPRVVSAEHSIVHPPSDDAAALLPRSAITPSSKPFASRPVPPSPARFWVPESGAPSLLPAQRILLVQSLMLHRAPAVVRTLAFQERLRQWAATIEIGPEIQVREAEDARPKLSGRRSQEDPSAPEPSLHGVDGQGQVGGSQTVALSHKQLSAPAPPKLRSGRQADAATRAHDHSQPRPNGASSRQEGRDTSDEPTASAEQVQPQAIDDEELFQAKAPWSPLVAGQEVARREEQGPPFRALDTEFGGVFYLLSLALYLYIYADFTSPAKPGLELNAWDFLALVASELTGGAVESDALWDELAELAGRPKSARPGVGFDAPDEWRLPPEWLEPFLEDYKPLPELINGRWIAVHPAGFTVLDAPASTASDSALEKGTGANRLQRWVGWMASYFRARLVLALGRSDAVALVCHRNAHIRMTLTHVDVTFNLDRHPIELRMAGLDRDLGWVPAAGRYVLFHYE